MSKRLRTFRTLLYVLIGILIVIPYLGMYGMKIWYNHEVDKISNAKFIVIDKEAMELTLIGYQGDELRRYAISCGKNYGNKTKVGDLKTPEGIFRISSIENASAWEHDFKDGNGIIKGAYGPWFLRLAVPGHKGIGIHGTHKPESITTRDTEGCIRLENDDIEELRQLVNVGMTVIILPSYADLSVNQRDSLTEFIKSYHTMGRN